MTNTQTNSLHNQTLHQSFELVERKMIESLMIQVTVSRHVQTGAIHYHLAHASDENAFMVAFRTLPMNSKGTAHVLEHTALCGSHKYPVRDPFFSMIKRSLQTFMNAFTASDWTAYPFATQNKKDFDNLLGVYLDAAFFPSLHELDFAQEGVRVELNEQDKPEFKGIVFNEMKGAMSGEIDQLYQALSSALYTETTYHYNSGGDPKDIIDLKHQDLLDFHKEHYHPSNAILMSFGNNPLADIQQQCDELALSKFGKGKKFASVAEPLLTEPKYATVPYAVEQKAPQQAHNVVAWLMPSMTDTKKRLTLRLIEGILIEHSGSVLRAALESHPLATAPSPMLGLDDSNYQMVFYAGVRGSEEEHAKQIESDILVVLKDVASKPIPKEEIDMVLHQIELNQKHVSGDGMPYGLTLLLDGLSTAVHDGNAIDVWEVQPHLDWLNEKLQDENWLSGQIQKLIIDNPHRVCLTMTGDDTLTERMAQEEQSKLDELEKVLTRADKDQLTQQAQLLEQRQAQPDDISLLPKVGFEDIPENIEFAKGSTTDVQLFGAQGTVHEYVTGTNGLYYAQLIIPLTDDVFANPLLGSYVGFMGELGTKQRSHADFQALQAQCSGGISIKVSQRTALDDIDGYAAYLVFSTRALNRNLSALDVIKECVEETIFSEHTRIQELLAQKQAGWQSRVSRNAHAYAMQAANSSYSKLATINYATAGLPALLELKDLVEASKDAEKLQAFMERIESLHQSIMQLPKQLLLVAEKQQLNTLKDYTTQHWSAALEFTSMQNETNKPQKVEFTPITADTAWLMQTNVYCHALSYKACTVEDADTPALMVLGVYLKNNFLHTRIREQGGAYGAGAGYDATACCFRFFSYRDPRNQETYDDFVASIDWLLSEEQDPAWLEEAIMGIIAGVDKPGSPAGEAVKMCFADLHGRTADWQRTLRSAILSVTLADLQRVTQKYLVDADAIKVAVAPYNTEEMLTASGFNIIKLPV